jgi:hypothetical protein
MVKITYSQAEIEQPKVAEFKNMDEFIMLQMREIPALQDHLKVLSLEIDGQPVEFSGTIEDLFDKYNK